MQLMLENSPEKQNAYAEHCTIFPDNRPYADLLRRDDHHPLCAYHHGKLRIPHIIGMVLAGVLIGKYGLNILERDSSLELFGKVGLYYIMFLAALEMDMEGMKKTKSRLLTYGLLTCFIPFGLTYWMSVTLLDYSTKASFLLSCIMASNTLIAYPIVSRYGLQQKPSVTLSVGSSMISCSSP